MIPVVSTVRAAFAATVLAGALAAAVSGSAPAQGEVDVRIYRDQLGVPHIEADSVEGLAYGTGYALAEDRLFLTAGIRLTAQGRLSELIGEPGLEADTVIRRDFYDAADVQRQFERLPAGVKRELQAFSDGFNDGMAEAMADPSRRPALFDVLGYEPEPWKPTDSVSVVMLFSYVNFAGEGGAGQLENAELLARLADRFGRDWGRRMWGDFVFRGDPGAPTVIPRGEGAAAPGSIRRERPGRAQLRLARRFGPELGKLAEARVTETNLVEEILRRVPFPKIGSYATAISGKRTEGGGGLLLGSPQAGITAPSIFWQLGQHAPGRNCTGFTVPGLGPWTGIGWCGGHAWSLVAGNAGEQVDNYVERLHPDDPRRYRYRDRWREMEVRTETFEVNRCVPPICEEPQPPRTETVELEHTVHGPVVARDEERGIAISQRRIQEGRWARSIETVVGWNEARSLREFEAATRKATGTYNLFYADRDGHALYRFTGLQPVRDRGIDRRLPSPGNGRREWRGRLGFRQMPHAVNPRSGVLVSNQGIESDPIGWWPNASGVPIGQASRVGGNRRLLARSGLDPQRLQEINPLLLERRDHITAVFARNLVRALRDTGNARLREALDLLREWKRDRFARVDRDGDDRYDHPAMTIFGADNFNLPAEDYPRHLWTDLLDRVFADELGERTEPGEQGTFEAPGTYLGQLSRLKLALDGRRSGIRLARSYPDDIDTKRREGAGRVIRESLAETLARLEAEFGTPEMRQWTRPVVETEFTALGAAAPPPITGFDHGTYSQIVDPRATDGRYILPPGNGSADSAAQTAAAQAGQFPEHFADQRELYEDYNFIQMPRRASQYTANPESVTELDYPDG